MKSQATSYADMPKVRFPNHPRRDGRVSTNYLLWTSGIMFVNGGLVMVIINMAGWCA